MTDPSLFDLMDAGDVAALECALRAGADANTMRIDGVTPLIVAVSAGKAEFVRALIKHGADPLLPSREGWHAFAFAKNSGQDEIANLLLEAQGGVEPRFDYAKHFLAKAEPSQIAIYQALHDEPTLARKPFYNIGSGNWRHPYWTNVDYASDHYNYDSGLIDIAWDIALLQPIDVESGSAELAYCSHTCEHLTNEQNRHVFREMKRILRPGGVFRITCPHAGLYYEAFLRRDIYASAHYGHDQPFGSPGVGYGADEMSVWLANEIASQTVRKIDAAHTPAFGHDPAALNRIFDAMPMEEAFDHLCGLIDFEIHRREPGCHINWWTPQKAVSELLAAGFSRAIVGVAGGSVSPLMRDRAFFDLVQPSFSLFVEGIA